MSTYQNVVVILGLSSTLGLSLVVGGESAGGMSGNFVHAGDIFAESHVETQGVFRSEREGTEEVSRAVQLWVSQSLAEADGIELARRAAAISLGMRANRFGSEGAPRTVHVSGRVLRDGRAVLASVCQRGGEYSVDAIEESAKGVMESPRISQEGGCPFCGFGDVFLAYDGGEITAMAVTSTDRFGALQALVAFPDGRKVGFSSPQLAELTTTESSRLIMFVKGWNKGVDVYRVVEVTDHVEDLVSPLRLPSSGLEPGREPDWSDAQSRSYREAVAGLQGRFQSIVLARGAVLARTPAP